MNRINKFEAARGACRRSMLVAFVLIPLILRSAAGQQVVKTAAGPEARYYRLICLVHMTGSGKHTDPIRPEFVPTTAATGRDGILAWSVQMTDDNKMAIVHLVAANRKAFDPILNDKRPEVKVFEIGKHGKSEIEGEMKKYKKDFDLQKFQVLVQ